MATSLGKRKLCIQISFTQLKIGPWVSRRGWLIYIYIYIYILSTLGTNFATQFIYIYILAFPKKVDLRIAKNYWGITMAATIYNVLRLNRIESEIVKILRENQNGFPSNHRTSYKTTRGDTLIRSFLPGIWLHTQRKDGANTTSIWSPQRNCHSHNDAL